MKSCADMVDMLDMKMFSLNQAIMAVEEEERRVEEEKRREREKAEKDRKNLQETVQRRPFPLLLRQGIPAAKI